MRRAFVRIGTQRILVSDTITILEPEDDGSIVVCGSHGGVSSAQFVMGRAFKAVFYNDAGIGKADAGVAGLMVLERLGLPALAVSHESAEIGDGDDAWRHGVVSRANMPAMSCGIKLGSSVYATAAKLAQLPVVKTTTATTPSLTRSYETAGRNDLVLLDSVSMLDADDRDAIVVTGSHGGAVSAEFATRHRPSFVAFNDAGIGRNDAGCAALGILDARKIAAVTVSCATARIGIPHDTLRHGVVSRTNSAARALGLVSEKALFSQLHTLALPIHRPSIEEMHR